MSEYWFSHCLKFLTIVLFASVSLAQEGATTSEDLRTWTSKQGKEVQGRLVGVEGEKIRLLVKGKEYSIPLAGLSDSDNEYVKEWQQLLSVADIRQLHVFRTQGDYEIRGRNGEVIDSISSDDSIGIDGGSSSSQQNVKKELAIRGKQILAGQSIHTKAGSSVDLYSTSGAVVQVQGDTELHISEEKEDTRASSLELLKGRLFLNVDAKQLQSDRKEFRLKTPTAILAVKGTQFFANVKTGETVSGVYEGKVEGALPPEQIENIEPGLVAQFYEDRIETRKMTEEEREERKVFDALSVRKSSLAEQTWGWNAFDWEVHSLLRIDGPSGKQEVSNINIKRGRNNAGNLAVQFRPIDESFNYGEFRIDSVFPKFGDGFLGVEFKIKANRKIPLIITTIGADQKELDKKKGGLLDRKAFEFLVEFHNLATIEEHKNQYWRNYQLEEDKVLLESGEWATYFVPFSRNDYPEDYDVKSWFVFLCFGPEVVAERETIELEIAPPVLVFEEGTSPQR